MKTFDLRKTSIQQFCTRPVNTIEVDDSVEKICLDVKNRGDRAIFEYALKFDSFKDSEFQIDKKLIIDSYKNISPKELEALMAAKENIEKFHSLQLPTNKKTVNKQGVELGTSWKPLKRVGLYIPGGTAPLVSTILMLALPAKIAGVEEIVAITPAKSISSLSPALLAAFNLCGIGEAIA